MGFAQTDYILFSISCHRMISYYLLVFFSGCPAGESQGCRNHFNVFQGCMRLLRLDSRIMDLIAVRQKQLGNYSNLQIDMCGIIDRFVVKTILLF